MKDAAAVGAAAVAGWIVGSARTGGTGVLVGLLFLTCAALGSLRPRLALLLGVTAAAPTAALGIVFDANAAALVAFVPALLGAYAGAFARVLLVRGNAA